MTGSNVVNDLKGGGGGARGSAPKGAKPFLLVTDNRMSRLNSPFCVITQHRKFEFGHHRQSKKINNAQELTMQLSQTLSSAIAQDIYWIGFVSGFGFYRCQISKRSTSGYRTFRVLVEYSFVLLN